MFKLLKVIKYNNKHIFSNNKYSYSYLDSKQEEMKLIKEQQECNIMGSVYLAGSFLGISTCLSYVIGNHYLLLPSMLCVPVFFNYLNISKKLKESECQLDIQIRSEQFEKMKEREKNISK
jgi:hypothetical protein